MLFDPQKHCKCNAKSVPKEQWSAICQSVLGPEWDYADTFKAYNCGLNCPDQAIPKCKKVKSSSGDPQLDPTGEIKRTCCLYGASGEDDKTCDAQHNFRSLACSEQLSAFCRETDSITKRPKIWGWNECKTYCNEDVHKPWCRAAKGDYCLKLGPEMVKDPDCMAFCGIAENKADYCDTNVEAYCKSATGQADQRCACINSTYPTAYGPTCFDPNCKTGYKTKAQIDLAKSCPLCDKYISDQETFLKTNNITIPCDIKKPTQAPAPTPSPTPTPAPTPALPVQTPAPTPPGQITVSTSATIAIAVAIFCFVLSIIIALIFIKNQQPNLT